MHRSLHILEIRESICDLLMAEMIRWEEHPGKRNLLSLALTCKDFSKPALSALWFKLTDLEALLRLLPRDLFLLSSDEETGQRRSQAIWTG